MYKRLFLAVALAGVAATTLYFGSAPAPQAQRRELLSSDPLDRACALEDQLLVRLWRGFDARRSEDVVVVPREPNYFGSFEVTSHTGPWNYVQEIPLVFYGPKFAPSAVTSNRPANLVDVFPTIGELLGLDLPHRDGSALPEVLDAAGQSRPDLVVVIVWDGVGNNVLARWPGRWPNLERLQRGGVSYTNATVGSSPSITPASHSNLGTGAWPRDHRVTAIRMRIRGRPDRSFRGLDPKALERSTFADEVDLAFNNRSLVGLVGWQTWHLGLLGHGKAFAGGDKDIVAMIQDDGSVRGRPDLYSTPRYLSEAGPGLARRIRAVDRADGAADGEWLGHDVSEKETPAWVSYESDVLMNLLRREGFGSDATPDFMLANFKMTDIVGHFYTMDSPEMAEVLDSQDDALGRLVDHLESNQREFVVVVTADHGHTPARERSSAWPISQSELIADLDNHFGIEGNRSLVAKSHAAGYFLNRELMDESGIEPADIARWLNQYTLGANLVGEAPPEYRDRVGELLFSAAFPGSAMDDVMRCAFGASRPPGSVDA